MNRALRLYARSIDNRQANDHGNNEDKVSHSDRILARKRFHLAISQLSDVAPGGSPFIGGKQIAMGFALIAGILSGPQVRSTVLERSLIVCLERGLHLIGFELRQ